MRRPSAARAGLSGRLLKRLRYVRRRRVVRSRYEHPRSAAETAAPALSLDMDIDSRTMLLACGGLNRQIGIPPFEFLSLSRELPVKRLFLRDPRQAWYHQGIPAHGSTIAAVAESLRELIAEHRVNRLVVAGNSAGGYAALVFGTLLGADAVLAFAPQTVLDLDVLAEMDDHRWDDHLRPLTMARSLDPTWLDLRTVLPDARRADTRLEVYFDDSLLVDRAHAERLGGLPGVTFYRFGRGAHDLVRNLRDSGALERCLKRALRSP